MKLVEISLKAFACLLVFFYIQPVLVWNNPNLYFFAGALFVAAYLSQTTKQPEFELRLDRNLVLGVLLIAVGLLGPVLSGFSTKDRTALAGLPPTATDTGLPVLDVHKVPLLSRDVAVQVMTRKLEDDASLRSQFILGSPVKQALQGQLVWVAPLEPRSAIAAFFGAPAPAYAMVDASDAGSARLVKADIAVSNRNFIGLDTRVWMHNPTLDVYGWYFELDDDGRPHWIGILTERKIGFRGYDVVGAVAIDVTTAEQTRYARDEVPKWVNNKFPMELVASQINAAGDLVNGLFDFSDDGKFELASGLNMVYFEDKPWYLGLLSSVGEDRIIQEVVLVDTQTKATRRVQLSGIADDEAARVLEARSPHGGLRASNPVPYLVGGSPAYVASLADENGILQAFGVVSVKSGEVYAIGSTLPDALERYSTRLREVKAMMTVTGDIERAPAKSRRLPFV
ncbi:hypothetical protein [Burkholderia ubonensis]|uniref:hypothetical protein n=1 Tax=Burkholderia ubonensis TaxID=101571 RepID=UPI0007580264|nr:hypothetical protein [Burkholderia ubonensis]KVP39483.1 hypothetical protein WJ87_04410 [Burkholderia ubonensis]